eukprot:gene16152-19973_t
MALIVAQSFTPLRSIPYLDDFNSSSADFADFGQGEADVYHLDVHNSTSNFSTSNFNDTANSSTVERVKVHNPCYDIQHYDMCCSDGEEEMCTPVHMAVASCMIAGILQILMGFLNFGFVVDYIGFTVLNGFTTAAAVTIGMSQVKYIFGLKDLPETRWPDFVIGISAMFLTYLGEKLKAKYTPIKDDSAMNKFIWFLGA